MNDYLQTIDKNISFPAVKFTVFSAIHNDKNYLKSHKKNLFKSKIRYQGSLLSSSTCNAFDFSSSPSCLLANLTALEERQVTVCTVHHILVIFLCLYWCLWTLTEFSFCSLSLQLRILFSLFTGDRCRLARVDNGFILFDISCSLFLPWRRRLLQCCKVGNEYALPNF